MKLIIALIGFRAFACGRGNRGEWDDERAHDFDEYDFGGPIPRFDDTPVLQRGIDFKVNDVNLPPLTYMKKPTFWRGERPAIKWPEAQSRFAKAHPQTQRKVHPLLEKARNESRRAWKMQQSNYKALRGDHLKRTLDTSETYRPPNLLSYDSQTYRPPNLVSHTTTKHRRPRVTYESNL